MALAVVAALIFAGVVWAAPAWADRWSPVDCEQNPDQPGCDVIAQDDETYRQTGTGQLACYDDEGEEVPCHIPGVGWRGADGCYYQQVPVQEVLDNFVQDNPITDEALTSGVWLKRRCPLNEELTEFTDGSYEWRQDGQVPGLSRLVQVAVSRLVPPAPQIEISPPPPAPQLVRLPMWLWVNEQTWGPQSATASVPGVSVTATATPTEVVWSTGDGGSRTCPGAGTPWRSGTDPWAASPDCGHTYTTSSRSAPGGVFELRARVTWGISWVGGGSAGTVAPLTTTSAVEVEVAESRTRNTGGLP